MPAKIVEYCGYYDVACVECNRVLCLGQPFEAADRLAANHNELFHERRLKSAESSA
jgi:hypothetical protein